MAYIIPTVRRSGGELRQYNVQLLTGLLLTTREPLEPTVGARLDHVVVVAS